MPLYEYLCPECDERFDELMKMDDRHTAPCPQCGTTAAQQVTSARIDYRMGVSKDFPTAYDKWTKIQESKNKQEGKMWDSNNNRYGGEHER